MEYYRFLILTFLNEIYTCCCGNNSKEPRVHIRNTCGHGGGGGAEKTKE